MYSLEMNDLWTREKRKGGYFVPGGWSLVYGMWQVDAAREAMWVAALMPEMNHDQPKVLKEVRKRADQLGGSFERQGIIEFLKRLAEQYAQRFPDLVQPDRSLRGFDPAKAQHYYLPYRAKTGRDGDVNTRQALFQMAQNARNSEMARSTGPRSDAA
jgi:hypothetical protein